MMWLLRKDQVEVVTRPGARYLCVCASSVDHVCAYGIRHCYITHSLPPLPPLSLPSPLSHTHTQSAIPDTLIPEEYHIVKHPGVKGLEIHDEYVQTLKQLKSVKR